MMGTAPTSTKFNELIAHQFRIDYDDDDPVLFAVYIASAMAWAKVWNGDPVREWDRFNVFLEQMADEERNPPEWGEA